MSSERFSVHRDGHGISFSSSYGRPFLACFAKPSTSGLRGLHRCVCSMAHKHGSAIALDYLCTCRYKAMPDSEGVCKRTDGMNTISHRQECSCAACWKHHTAQSDAHGRRSPHLLCLVMAPDVRQIFDQELFVQEYTLLTSGL